MDEDYQDGYMDGRYWQPCANDRGASQDAYDAGYIQGSSDFLTAREYQNGASLLRLLRNGN